MYRSVRNKVHLKYFRALMRAAAASMNLLCINLMTKERILFWLRLQAWKISFRWIWARQQKRRPMRRCCVQWIAWTGKQVQRWSSKKTVQRSNVEYGSLNKTGTFVHVAVPMDDSAVPARETVSIGCWERSCRTGMALLKRQLCYWSWLLRLAAIFVLEWMALGPIIWVFYTGRVAI